MKTFCVIFAFFMAYLSVIPCSDGQIRHDTEKAGCEIPVADDSHEDGTHEHEDSCTPFCVCSCCGSGVTFVFPVISFPIVPTVLDAEYPATDNSFSSFYLYNIWQPPKA